MNQSKPFEAVLTHREPPIGEQFLALQAYTMEPGFLREDQSMGQLVPIPGFRYHPRLSKAHVLEPTMPSCGIPSPEHTRCHEGRCDPC